MKQFSLLTFTLLICALAQAQIKQGDIVLGGNLGYTSQSWSTQYSTGSPSSTKNQTLTIAPSIGSVIKDNLVLGFDLAYSHSKTDGNPGESTSGNGFTGGIFLRKYRSLGNGFYLFGQARLTGNYMHTTQDNPGGSQITSDVTNQYGFGLQLFPGIAYALNSKWQLEMGLTNFFVINYTHSEQTQTYTNQQDWHNTGEYFSAQSSLTGATTFTIGLRYFIGS